MPRAAKNLRVGEKVIAMLQARVDEGVALDVNSLAHSILFQYLTGQLRNFAEPNGTPNVPNSLQGNIKEQNGTGEEPNSTPNVPNSSETPPQFNAAARLRAAMSNTQNPIQ